MITHDEMLALVNVVFVDFKPMCFTERCYTGRRVKSARTRVADEVHFVVRELTSLIILFLHSNVLKLFVIRCLLRRGDWSLRFEFLHQPL